MCSEYRSFPSSDNNILGGEGGGWGGGGGGEWSMAKMLGQASNISYFLPPLESTFPIITLYFYKHLIPNPSGLLGQPNKN